MANQDHLAILAKGVSAWNAWRKENVGIVPDFADANLSGADLSGVDLSGAGNRHFSLLYGANLNRANLSRANLAGAHFSDAKLFGANLSHAFLFSAILSQTDLTGANLTDACLLTTLLRRAILVGAEFNRAQMGSTMIVDVDLSTPRGLDEVKHLEPSTIGIDTMFRSKGRIPDIFLRGAGVPENLITYMKSLTGAAFDFYSCFISYSSNDQDFAERLHADLQAKGVRCWYAPEDLKTGDEFRDRIDESIRIHDKLLVVLSRNSINSQWVEKEVETAFERERREKRTVLFPIRLDDAVMETSESWAADIRRTRHIGDFRGWEDQRNYARAFDRLLRDLKAQPGERSATKDTPPMEERAQQ